MNKKLFKLLTAGALVALLSSCGDTVVDNTLDPASNPVQTKASLNVLVRDASSGVPLVASVKLLSTGERDSTNATTGTVSFKDVPMGDHNVYIERPGYADAIYDALVKPVVNNGGNFAIAVDATVDASLYPLTASLQGSVFYSDIDGKKKAAAGTEVRIVLSDLSLVERVFTTTADDQGKFVFDTLPAVGTGYVIQIPSFPKDNPKYVGKEIRGSNLGASLLNGIPASITSAGINYDNLNTIFALLTERVEVKSTDTITLDFSNDIDVAKFKSSSITIFGNSVEIPALKIASGSKIKLFPRGAIDTAGAAAKWPRTLSIEINNLVAASGKEIRHAELDNIIISDLANKFELVKYKKNIKSKDIKDTLSFEFSENIDAKKFIIGNGGPNSGTVTIDGSSSYFDKIISANFLKLVPHNAWAGNFSICFDQLKAVSGNVYNDCTESIKVEEEDLTGKQVLGLVQDLDSIGNSSKIQANWNSNSVFLKWNRLSGATRYRIYAKASIGTKKDDFVYIQDVPATSSSIPGTTENAEITIPNNGITSTWNDPLGLYYLTRPHYAFQDSNKVEFLVQAYNSSSETNVNNAKNGSTVTIVDKKSPSIDGYNSESYFYYPSLNQVVASLTAPDTTMIGCVYFPEPMDTTVVKATSGTLTSSPDLSTKMSFRLNWSNRNSGNRYGNFPGDTYLCIDRIVNTNPAITGAPGETINATFTISGLTDKAKNPVVVTYGTSKTNTIIVKFNTYTFY